MDFGLANYFDTTLDPSLRSLHTQCGSPHYASPEILTGAKYSGPLADVWSLGVLLFAMLCGSLPFNARSVPLLIKKIVEGKFKFPKFLSPSSRHLISSILQIQPEQRPSLEEIQRHPWLQQHGGAGGVRGREEGADGETSAAELDGTTATPPPVRPLSRPEVINPESGRPMPGDLQRLMLHQKESQRKVIGGAAAEPLPRSDVLHFKTEEELLGLSSPTSATSPTFLQPGTPSHQSGPSSVTTSGKASPAQGPVSASSSSSSFFADLLSFPSPRKRLGKAIKCHLCGKTLNVRVSESGELLLASAAAAGGDSLMASKYELCACLRTRSHSPVSTDRGLDATADSADRLSLSSTTVSSSASTSSIDRDDPSTFAPQSFRENYFHPDDPRRKNAPRRREEQPAAMVSASEQRRREEEEAVRARDEERFLRACEDGDVDAVVLLIEPPTDEQGLSTGPPLVDVRAKHIDNWTGLHYAARGGHVQVLQALLSSLQPLDVNCRTKSSWSALMIAADKGHMEVCALLVRYGAAIHITNGDGKSAIFLARESGYHEIAQLLTHASSVRHKRHARLHEEKEEGEKRLSYELFRAAEYGDVHKVQHLLQLGRQDTKEHVSRRQGKDKEKAGGGGGGGGGGGTSPPPSDEPLTRYSVDVAATGIDNWTALHFAARKGRAEVVQLLLTTQPAAPVNALTKNGWTALMMASDKGYTQVVRLLLEAGADPGIRSMDGYSAFRVAREAAHHDIVQLLLDWADTARRQQREREEPTRDGERRDRESKQEGVEEERAQSQLLDRVGQAEQPVRPPAAAADEAKQAADGGQHAPASAAQQTTRST